MRVFCYWNLHMECWSVKALEGPQKGRVVARVPEVVLLGAVPKVSQKGREKVLRERRKNVHAGLVGYWGESADLAPYGPNDYTGITYNPYKYKSFVYRDTEGAYSGSTVAHLTTDNQTNRGKVYVTN